MAGGESNNVSSQGQKKTMNILVMRTRRKMYKISKTQIKNIVTSQKTAPSQKRAK
jgi:hypothetical protein